MIFLEAVVVLVCREQEDVPEQAGLLAGQLFMIVRLGLRLSLYAAQTAVYRAN